MINKTVAPSDAPQALDLTSLPNARLVDRDDGSATPSLEEALEALDRILTELETGEVALDEAIGLYERGVLLAQQADTQLSAAELRVRQIDGDG